MRLHTHAMMGTRMTEPDTDPIEQVARLRATVEKFRATLGEPQP